MYQKAVNLFLKVLVGALFLPLFAACYSYEDEEKYVQEVLEQKGASYINLTIAVSNGVGQMTRAGEKPEAGENGDGREAGFMRENEIKGITLILYQDPGEGTDKGINGDPALPVKFIAYYPVSRSSQEDAGTQYGKTKHDEAVYTTGNQLIEKNSINFSESYYAIVVANADLRGQVETLGDVRDLTLRNLYEGKEQDAAENCKYFVMASEDNYKLVFPAPVASSAVGGNLLYSIEEPIRIERMAARIDFWAAGSNGYKTATDNPAYTTPGYEYAVDGTNDKFVVTGVMPFNLNGGDASNGNGGEYVIKRLANAVTPSPTIKYLADESGSNYVLDPATNVKVDGELSYFKNKLTGMGDLADVSSLSTNVFYKSVASMHAAVKVADNSAGFDAHTEGSLAGEDVIVTYPMENTLWSASRLYNNATGIAIEGDYYYDGTGTPEHRIFYGYLRHQGSSASAYSATLGTDMRRTETTTADNCMEFGIVRNNIYRIYISKINSIENMELKIKVKMWDKFTHDIIYM